MSLASLSLAHYRNYSDTTFSFEKETIFVGPNGSGKTNVIEALRNLSVTKSYRAEHDRDTIQWNESYCRLVWQAATEKIEYVLTQDEPMGGGKKVMKHNGVSVSLTQAYGLLPTVLFSPETMQLIDGSPQERRRFLDTILSQSDTTYIDSLMTYRKVMRERHYVLLRLQQKLGSGDELDFWDGELARAGGYIIEKRASFIAELQESVLRLYPQFRGKREEILSLVYKPSVRSGDDFRKRLVTNRGYDIKSGTTQSGPHRDELVFLFDDRDVTLFASRGELRRTVLAVKMAEAIYLRQTTGKEPWLLLDDVFSELDEERQHSLLDAVKDYQTVITATDLHSFSPAYQKKAQIYQLPLEDHGINA